MKPLFPFACLLLTALLPAQARTGRHFATESRLPATPAVPTVVDATATRTEHRVAPLAKLRSGRAWPSYHFTRLPETPATGSGPVDASLRKPAAKKRGFWYAHG